VKCPKCKGYLARVAELEAALAKEQEVSDDRAGSDRFAMYLVLRTDPKPDWTARVSRKSWPLPLPTHSECVLYAIRSDAQRAAESLAGDWHVQEVVVVYPLDAAPAQDGGYEQ